MPDPFKNVKIIELMELFDDDEVTTADQIDRPQQALDREAYEDFMKRNPLAGGGMLVQPGFGGVRQGYAGKMVAENIRLTPTGNAYEVAVQRGPEVFNKTFRKENYKNAREALKAAKEFRDEKKKIPFKTGIQEPKYGSGLSKEEYQKIYREETKELTEAGKLAKERDKKLKNFIGKKKKIKASVLRNFVLGLGYSNYDATRIRKKFPNLEIIKDIKQGTDFKPLSAKEKTLIKDNFDLPEGVKDWNFKQHRFGFSSDKYPRLFAQIKSRLGEGTKYKIAANFSDPQGWMMMSMNRVYENETVLKNGKRVLKKDIKKLTYEPITNKKGIIVGFKDNTVSGGGNTYYGLKKNAKEYGDGTAWTAHGDFEKVNKFIRIANGVKEQPDKVLSKILKDKGIDKLFKTKTKLTLNEILSHQRYYSKLAETSPKALIRRQIVLHHTGGVGAGDNLARAAATKDIQLLTDAVNLKVTELERIVQGTPTTPGRKLTKDEIGKLKNYGAKITDFDGKIVGGGFTSPERQFSEIRKGALQYAKGDEFNVKTVTKFLERLGCGKAAGGRVFYNEGALGLTKCAKKGQTKLGNILTKGTGQKSEQLLATQILKAGPLLRGAVSLPALLGPQAMIFYAGTEAGLIGYDMVTKGKTLKEAVGDSLLNPALGPKLKQDSQKLFVERLQNLGVSDQEIGKGLMFDRMSEDVQTLDDLLQRKSSLDQARTSQRMSPVVADKRKKEASDIAMDIQDIYRTGDRNVLDAFEGEFQRPETQEIFTNAAAQKIALEELAEADRLRSVLDNFYGKFIQGERGRKEAEEKVGRFFDTALEDANPALFSPVQRAGGFTSGFAGGGIAKLAGIDEGPPPESGPNSQGLSGLLKRGNKI